MADVFGIVVPEAASNLVLNPSAELTGNFAAYNGATITQSTTQARWGDYGYLVTASAASQGASLATTGSAASATHYVSGYVYGTITGSLQVAMNGSTGTWRTMEVIGGVTGSWVRYGASVAASLANNSVATLWRNTANESWRLDGVQVEAASYATTYFDGDLNGYCKWTGLRHGSSSTRDSQDRSGGRLRTLDEFGFSTVEVGGQGYAEVRHNLQSLSQQPGAVYQGYKIPPRNLRLRVDGRTATQGQTPLGSQAGLHSVIQDLTNLIKPDLVAGAQPFRMFYTGATTTTTRRLFADFVYAGGLEGDGQNNGPLATLNTTLNLLAVDPYWYDDDRVTAALDFTDSVTSAYSLRRVNGAWAAMGTGFDSNGAYVIVVDQERGRVYYGGGFTTANGVTVNKICYWNGTTFVAMDGGVNSTVLCMALAANGDVWVGGAFTTVGTAAAATKGLARWNIATGTWTAFNESTATFLDIKAIAIDASGAVYIGGNFTDWETDGTSDYIAKTSDGGTNWDSLGTGMNGIVWSITVHPDGKVYVGGEFTTANGVTVTRFTYWTGTTFVAMGATAGVNGTVFTICVLRNGNLVIGGGFTTAGGTSGYNYIAGWNGSAFTLLGTGLDNQVESLLEFPNGTLVVGGSFATAGGLALTDRLALWNGYTWAALDVDLPGSAIGRGLGQAQGTLYIATSTTGTAAAAGITTVTNTGLSDVYPDVSLIGPSSATATFQWLENQTSGDLLYFNLTINTLETIGISFAPGNKSVSTVWSGRPGARQISGDGGKSASSSSGGVRRGTGSATLLGAAGGRFTGIIRGQPLPGSDFAAFHLQPGANTIAAFATGTLTGMVAVMHFTPRHLSVDGAAA